MMILGVLGGSFDPVHRGHQALADEVLAAHLADRILVVPAWLSPHKDRAAASAAHRLAMAELAFAGVPDVEVDAREIAAGRACFTVDTLAGLQGDFPGARLRLIVGADNLASFDLWRRPQRILELAEIIVAHREGAPAALRELARLGLPAERFLFLENFRHPASSTRIRAHLAAGEAPADLLPSAVADYIEARGLYQSDGEG